MHAPPSPDLDNPSPEEIDAMLYDERDSEARLHACIHTPEARLHACIHTPEVRLHACIHTPEVRLVRVS